MANAVTVFRFLLSLPLFISMTLRWDIVGLVLFLLGALSDFLDGFIARRWQKVSVFGQFADPLADKLLVMAGLLVFLERGVVGAGFVMILLSRDFLVMGLRLLAISEGRVLGAGSWGKVKTVGQIFLIVWLFLGETLGWSSPLSAVKFVLIWGVGLASVWSGFLYFWENRSIFSRETDAQG